MARTSVEDLADLLLATDRERRLIEKRARYAKRREDPAEVERMRARGREAQRRFVARGQKPNRERQKAKPATAEGMERLKRRRAEYKRRLLQDPARKLQQQAAEKARRDRIHETPHGRCMTAARTHSTSCEALMGLLVKQRYRCAVTGLPLDFRYKDRHPLQPTVDHIIPKACGGTNDPSNLRWVIWVANFVRLDVAADSLLLELIRPSDALRARVEADAPDYVKGAI